MRPYFIKQGKADGRPLLFIHGWGVNSHVWSEQKERFAARRPVITVDLPGHGGSAPAGEPLTIPLCASLLAKLAEDEGWHGMDVVGWSLGAEVAALLAKNAPAVVRSLALVGGTPCYIAREEDAGYGTPSARARFFKRQLEREFRATLGVFIHSFFQAEGMDKERMREISNLFFDSSFPPDEKSGMELLDSLYEEDLREEFKGLSLPTMIIHGDRDMIVPHGAVLLWQELLTNSRSDVFRDCGHAPFLTEPERFFDSLNGFYKGLE